MFITAELWLVKVAFMRWLGFEFTLQHVLLLVLQTTFHSSPFEPNYSTFKMLATCATTTSTTHATEPPCVSGGGGGEEYEWKQGGWAGN